MFCFELVKKLSTQMTSHPSWSRRSQRWDPKKPDPPVTRTRFRKCMIIPPSWQEVSKLPQPGAVWKRKALGVPMRETRW